MKGNEDWVDGSWSVDCVCGVDYDDGKEMVNCDECGVWVHTWCCGYNNVKSGADDSFACHKCKIKTNDDIKTTSLRMVETNVSSQGPVFRSCNNSTEIPMEERVHVQGVPGGDVNLFEFPSVFSRQLWKCTGYVPKKFRVKYKEFPCWDDDEDSTVRLTDHKRTNDTTSWGLGDSQSVVNKDKLLGGSQGGVKKKVKVADKQEQDQV